MQATRLEPAADRPKIVVPPRNSGLRSRLGIHPGLLLIVAGALCFPAFGSPYWVFAVTVGFALAISCLGLVAVVGWLRELSLMQAGLTGSTLYLAQSLDIGHRFADLGPMAFPVAAACGVAFAVGLSLLVAFVSMRLAGVYVAVLTLAVQFMLENTVMLSQIMTSAGWSGPNQPRPDLFGLSLQSDRRFYYAVLGVLIVSMAVLHRFRHSRFGRAMILVGADRQAAAAVGISPWRYRVWAFAIAGLFAGVAGAVSGPMYMGAPGTLAYVSFASLFYVAIPVLAGCESLMTVAGLAIFFTLAPELFYDAKLNEFLLVGVALAAGVLLGPRGVGGALADLFDGQRRARRRKEPDDERESPSRHRDWGPEPDDLGTIDLG